jgi:hypothetical protein
MLWSEVKDGATLCDIIGMEHSKFDIQEFSIYSHAIVN